MAIAEVNFLPQTFISQKYLLWLKANELSTHLKKQKDFQAKIMD